MKHLNDKYNHLEVEKDKYQNWVEQGYFTAGDLSKKPYCIVIPPPNVTGKLHLGHAWDTTLQDITIRYKRLQGYDALWLPGMDHAGIATQAKVDEKLRDQGLSRYDLGREKFLEEAWSWKEEYAGHIREQWAKLGLGLDYTRERFTLDEGLNRAVNHVFVKLYEKGLIYQGRRIINWDPQAKTALSNIEVIYKEIEGAEHYFKYKFVDGSGYLEVMTTRPETILGDGAIAVHPEDTRYNHLAGKEVYIPVCNRKIPIILDDYVSMDKGTGCVKITGAHDPNDYGVAKRHNIEMLMMMNEDGTIATADFIPEKYWGLDRFECRKQFIEDAKNQDCLVKVEPVVHSVGHSERTGVVVEPYLSKQWFVKMDTMAKRSVDNQATDNLINFVPKSFEKIFLNWMNGIEDWCISRQLWWGHRIPVWYHNETNEILCQEHAPEDIENYHQDEDVLDTWFSSALWPFSTLGWPDHTEDFKRYYPNDLLVTGYDIIFFWVSRMIFEALEFTDSRPFDDVLIHGLIRDSQGRKMSKSLGNGVDPMQVIEQYGADALRFFLTTNSAPGQDLRYIEEKVEASANFINKIWNAARFVKMNLDEDFKLELENLSLADNWILTRLNQVIEEVNTNMDKYEFGIVGNVLYKFIWDDYCSWYIELAKVNLHNENRNATMSTLVYVLDAILKMLHPFMPFVTEEIYQALPNAKASINQETYPQVKAEFADKTILSNINYLLETVTTMREIRKTYAVKMANPLSYQVVTNDESLTSFYKEYNTYTQKLVNSHLLAVTSDSLQGDITSHTIYNGVTIQVSLEGLIDKAAEIEKLKAEITKLDNEIARCEKMLSNEKFVSKAPATKLQEEKDKLANYQNQRQTSLNNLKKYE